MKTLTKRILRSVLYILHILVISASISHGGVVVFDQVTTLKTAVYLKVLTKGRFFSVGGKLVDIYINDNKMQRILTGGDGYGYYKYIPKRLGLTPIEARSEGERDTGNLLVIDKNDKVVLIEVESGLKESPLSDRPRRDSRHAVEDLIKAYKVIYLNNLLGAVLFKGWLAKEKFPESAVMKWQGPGMLKSFKKKGLNLYAIIGSASLISEADEHIQKRYTFDETKDGRTVKDWEEILELIQKESSQTDRPSEKK
jgi:hypothetical protein